MRKNDSRKEKVIDRLLRFAKKDAPDDAGEALPIGGVRRELLAAAFGDGIKLGFAIVVRDAPFAEIQPRCWRRTREA